MMRQMHWTLREMCELWQYQCETVVAAPVLDQPISGVSIDSRNVKSGDLFVAIKGDLFDGHAFVGQAIAQGALAAVVRRDWFRQNTTILGNFILVENTLEALQKMATAYRRKLNPYVLAITGTNGKTTTKEMIANVLATEMKTHKTFGNLNNHIGVPLTLLAMREPVEVAIVEMGMNHAHEITTLCMIAKPNAALITNIGRGHTEFFGSLEGVRKAKQEIFDYIATRGTACVNIDDPNVVQAAIDAGVQAERSFGFSSDAEIAGSNLKIEKDGTTSFRWQEHKISLSIPGMHNGANALAAICAGGVMGIAPENIIRGVQQPIEVSGRMCRLEIGGRVIIDDLYNANPESVEAALATLAALPGKGKRFAVLGDMLELGTLAGQSHRAVLQAATENKIDRVFTFGPEMAKATHSIGNPVISHLPDKKAIAEKIYQQSQPGDMILIKGSRGMKMEEVRDEFASLLA